MEDWKRSQCENLWKTGGCQLQLHSALSVITPGRSNINMDRNFLIPNLICTDPSALYLFCTRLIQLITCDFTLYSTVTNRTLSLMLFCFTVTSL